MDKYEKELPSPDKLRRKIILKHKKLPEGADENAGVPIDLDSSKNMDLSDSVKNGMLLIREEGAEELWKPHFFVLTPRQMVYSELPGRYLTMRVLTYGTYIRYIGTGYSFTPPHFPQG